VTCPAVRLPRQQKWYHRRSGTFPGRRFASVLACTVAATGATALPATAAADQTVVSATIFPGTPGGASTQQVTLSTLDTCGNYAGPSSIALQPTSNQQPISNPAWTLGTVLTCGLQIPVTDATAVEVVKFDGSPEDGLSNAQIFDTAQYPGTDGALPTIYVDGNEDQTTYVRPPQNPQDQNGADEVVQQGAPVSILVYEKQPPLTVTASQTPVSGSQTAAAEQVTLSATVTAADGSTIDPSQLTYSWTVGGSQMSTAASPTLSFPSGNTPVTVTVSDPGAGTGGTYTIDVPYSPPSGDPTPPTNKQPGAGTGKHGHPTGQTHGKKHARGNATKKLRDGGGLNHAGTNKGGSRTRSERSSTSASPTSAATTPTSSPKSTPATQTTSQTTTITTPTTTPAPGLSVDKTPTKAPSRKRTHAPKRGASRQGQSSERLVTGRLVADVAALPAGESPLVHPIAAGSAGPSLVHAAGDAISAPTWAYATLAVLALLGGGALYERRGRRGRTLHR
jgi:hypothetical protein